MSGPDYMTFFRDRAEQSRGMSDEARSDAMKLALWEYMQAKMVVPIDSRSVRAGTDPFACHMALPIGWEWPLLEAADAGGDMAVAFNEAFLDDHEDGYVWRAMKTDEGAKRGELLAAMSPTGQVEAARLLGLKNVVHQILADDAMHLMRMNPLKGA